MTRLNSARVSFVNRVKNEGFFTNATAARGLRVGHILWAKSRVADWAVLVASHACGRDAGVGHAIARRPRDRIHFSIIQ